MDLDFPNFRIFYLFIIFQIDGLEKEDYLFYSEINEFGIGDGIFSK